MANADAEILWLAGLWEGEGCFYWEKTHRLPKAALNMTDEDVIASAAALLAFLLPPMPRKNRPEQIVTYFRREPQRPGHLPSFSLLLSSRRALALMALLRPYVHKRRREKIDELFDLWEKRNAE
jgi:hypothetical protein